MKNCQHEPPYPDHETVLFSMRDPNMTAHKKSERCGIEEPHLIANCGEFLAGRDLSGEGK